MPRPNRSQQQDKQQQDRPPQDRQDRQPQDRQDRQPQDRQDRQPHEKQQPPTEPVDGVLELTNQGHGFLRRDPNWIPSREDLFVPNGLVRQFGLRTGQQIRASWRPPAKGQRSASVSQVLDIEGEPPATARNWPSFDRLVAESPTRRILLENDPEEISGRAIDLFAPMGFGQRGLVIAQPFAGKTTLLRNIANSIAARYPESERFILLVDERPEEVTDFRRAEVGHVIGSSFDLGTENHLKNAELLLARAHRLVEAGKDVVILVDSLTRLARASNLSGKQSGRTLTGGLDPTALQFPRRMFGAARATDGGGTLTIIATVLVDTGSRMDDMVYEEFKGTGNWELRLDRKLAEARLFPAIDIPATGTRREELLYSEPELLAVQRLRRWLHGQAGDRQEQLDLLLKLLKRFPSNQQLVEAASQLQAPAAASGRK
jgi:transcription termination factor Rho